MRIAIAVALFGIAIHAMADQLRAPVPVVFSSPTNEYYLRLVPGPFPSPLEDTKGGVYKVAADKDELMYETTGWYSFHVLVSVNGESLARVEQSPMRGIRASQTPVVAFYSRGVLSSQYMLSDLVDNLDCLTGTLSMYFWSGPLRWGVNAMGEIAVLDTYDGQSIVFEMKTGRILEKRRIATGCSEP